MVPTRIVHAFVVVIIVAILVVIAVVVFITATTILVDHIGLLLGSVLCLIGC